MIQTMLKTRIEGEELIISISQLNKINTLFSDALESEINKLVSKTGKNIVLNLDGIRFVDSSGFSMLRRIHNRLQSESRQFSLCNAGNDVLELVRLMELDNEFHFCERNLSGESILLEVDSF